MRKLLLAAAVTAALAACAHAHTASPQAKASISALASIPGADATAMLVRAGVPLYGTSAQQVAFGKSMLTGANRKALARRLEIPRANQAAFEAGVLSLAKSDHLSTHAGRVRFLDRDLPGLVAREQ